MPAHFACGVATTLPDVPSDTLSGKRSFAVVHGATATTWASTAALLGSALALQLLGGARGSLLALAGVLALGQAALGPAPPGSTRLVVRLAHLVGAALALQLAVVVP
jgi:hypothetical protein